MNNPETKVVASNKAKMQYVMNELARGNRTPFGELMADDFCWKMIGYTAWSGTYIGKDDVQNRLMKPLFEKFADEYTNRAKRLVAEDDVVVVECEGKATTKAGKPYNNTYCYICSFADG